MQFCDPVKPCASTRIGVASASDYGLKSGEQSANVNPLKLPTSDVEEEKFTTEQNCRTKLSKINLELKSTYFGTVFSFI